MEEIAVAVLGGALGGLVGAALGQGILWLSREQGRDRERMER